MAITTTNINTGGAVVLIGGTVETEANTDGFFDVSPAGTDIGCTQGGVTVTYSLETDDIFCDQTTAAVKALVTAETATVEFDMLESQAENLKLIMGSMASSTDGASAYWVGIGGITTISYQALELKITDNDTGYLTYWTFFKTLVNGFGISFERGAAQAVSVTLAAYADTDHASGKQLFQIKQHKS